MNKRPDALPPSSNGQERGSDCLYEFVLVSTIILPFIIGFMVGRLTA
jgi:hypothetical protein